MVMFALLPEVFSVAVTLRIPLTSTSKTTSRTASPAFMGGIGARVNSPSEVLSSQLTRSPWNTGNCTVCWLSATVVKVLEWIPESACLHYRDLGNITEVDHDMPRLMVWQCIGLTNQPRFWLLSMKDFRNKTLP